MYAQEITTQNFENEVIYEKKPVLLDFWASWCGSCRMLLPVIEEIAEERPEVKVAKIDVDNQPELAAAFNVMCILTFSHNEGR
jgi:thioredoxin 1